MGEKFSLPIVHAGAVNDRHCGELMEDYCPTKLYSVGSPWPDAE